MSNGMTDIFLIQAFIGFMSDGMTDIFLIQAFIGFMSDGMTGYFPHSGIHRLYE
jgi:hypothetical protein